VDPAALRTTPPAKPDSFDKSVEKGQYETMAPQPVVTADRTNCRTGPGKISPQPGNLLEGNRKIEYHSPCLVGWENTHPELGAALGKASAPFLSYNIDAYRVKAGKDGRLKKNRCQRARPARKTPPGGVWTLPEIVRVSTLRAATRSICKSRKRRRGGKEEEKRREEKKKTNLD
jgi:hypothetical protein